jgi:hypothetical protein
MGSRVEFRLLFDALEHSFENDAFDVIVLAHCTWYFSDPTVLRRILSHVRPWSRKLCLSEWDLQPQTIEQLGHLLAVLIQGQTEAYKLESHANVRSPYSREYLRTVLSETGWDVASDRLVDTSELADARWEIAMCLQNSEREAAELMPARLQFLQRSLIDVLRRCEAKPLPSYSITALRSEES